MLYDITNEDSIQPKDQLDIMQSNMCFLWNYENKLPEKKLPTINDAVNKNQSWFNLFAELDPLSNNDNGPFLQNSEAT